MSTSDATQSRLRWELENDINNIGSIDELFKHDEQQSLNLQNTRPWAEDHQYFKNVWMSATALLKISLHARSGDKNEVMGMLQGKVVKEAFIVLDSFALNVEGTETRVNAQAEAYEYMVSFHNLEKERNGRMENIVGWYHSHPGYGCWLSGIDTSTQMTNQTYQEPFLAVVVDPVRTAATGKVDIGSFRTYPENYTPPEASHDQFQAIPLNKIEDFGVHANRYYSLNMRFFKTSFSGYILDLLWDKYWASTLASYPLKGAQEFTSRQILDIAEKLDKQVIGGGRIHGGRGMETRFGPQRGQSRMRQTSRKSVGQGPHSTKEKEDKDKNMGILSPAEEQFEKILKESSGLAMEHIQGLSSQLIKQQLFNTKFNQEVKDTKLQEVIQQAASSNTQSQMET